MNVVILQPSYIPWRGYFDQIGRAGLFVFYDDVQYDKRGWRNRNQIRTPTGKQWLTIPVHSRGTQTENIPINRIRIAWADSWNQAHFKAIQHSYRRAPYFDRYLPLLETLYQRHDEFLADFTIEFTIALAHELGNTPEYTLILSGDHLYRMDYGEMAEFHREKHADITLAVQPVARSEASRFGILKRD